MVQIIEENRRPTFGQRLSEGIGRGIEGYSQIARQLQEEKIAQQLAEREGIQSQQKYSQQLGLEEAKRKSQIESMEKEYALKGDLEEKKASFKKGPESKQTKDIAQTAFDTAANILKKGNIGLGSGILSKFGGETAEDVGEFQSAIGGIEAMLVDMVSRGTLSDARFKYITETLLPKPNDTQAMIKGKMKSLSKILGLNPQSLIGKEQESNLEKVQEGRKSIKEIFG